MQEVIQRRTRNSKTHFIETLPNGRQRFSLDCSIGSKHYQQNPHQASPWLDIDTRITRAGLVRAAPYDLDAFLTGMPGFRYKSKHSGEFIIRLRGARGLLASLTPAPVIVGNQVIWKNMYPDTDIVAEVQSDRVVLKRILKSPSAPLEYDMDIEQVQGGRAMVRPLMPAQDAGGQLLKMEETSISGGRAEKLSLEVVGGIGIPRPITYPIADSVTVDEQVGASLDDCYRRLDTSEWDTTGSWGATGLYGAGAAQYGCGFRFQTVALPNGCTIDVAYLTVTAYSSYNGTTCNNRISAEDTDDAAAFSTSGDFDTRWAARTTARVDWDNIVAMTDGDITNSPSIVSIEQELVNRALWASGQDQVFFLEDFEDRSTIVSGNPVRTISMWNHIAGEACKFHVEYTVAGGWTGKIMGVTNPAKIDGVAVAGISTVMGVSAQ